MNMPTKSGTNAIYLKYLMGLCGRCIHVSYEVTALNHVMTSTVHIFDIHH